MLKRFIFLFVLISCSATWGYSQIDTTALFKEAGELFGANKFEEGIAPLDKIIAAYPNCKEAIFAKGLANIKLRKYDKAKPDLFKAAALFDNPVDRIFGVGWAIIQNMPTEDALSALPYFDEALRRDPNYCDANYGKALMYYYLKDFSESAAQFQPAMTKCPDKAQEMNLYYCNALYESGRTADAYAAMEKVLKKIPQYADGVLIRMDWYKKEEKYDLALQDANLLLSWGPNEGKWYSQRAIVYALMGKKDEACADVMKSQDLGDQYGTMMVGKNCIDPDGKIVVKPGTKLKYLVNFYGDEYFFTATVKEFSKTKVSFEWEMSNDPAMKGKFTMGQNALVASGLMHNVFTAGEDIVTDEETSVWASRKVYEAAKNMTEISLNAGYGAEMFGNTIPATAQIRNGNRFIEVNAIAIAPADFSQSIYILDDPENPLILKMELGWSIELVDVR